VPRDQPGRRCRVEKRKRVSDGSDSDEDEHELLFARVDNQGNTGCEHVGDQNDRENSNASGSDSGERSNSSSSGGVSDQSSDGGSGSESDDESASSDESDSDDKSDDDESESESDDESDSDGDERSSSSSRRGKAKAARAKPKAKPKSTSKLPEIQNSDTIIEGRWWEGVPNAAAAPAPRQRPPVAAETTSSPSSTGATAAATAPAISPAAVSSARERDRGANRTFTGDEAYSAHDKFSNITMLRQPPNSPDFNVLDEGIFHRLQTAVDKERPFFETKNIFYARRQLEECVMNAWDDMTGDQVRTTCEHMNDVFRTVIRLKGGNYYHHASKDE